jgi:hypothetical protein
MWVRRFASSADPRPKNFIACSGVFTLSTVCPTRLTTPTALSGHAVQSFFGQFTVGPKHQLNSLTQILADLFKRLALAVSARNLLHKTDIALGHRHIDSGESHGRTSQIRGQNRSTTSTTTLGEQGNDDCHGPLSSTGKRQLNGYAAAHGASRTAQAHGPELPAHICARTSANSGSRPLTNHTARLYRESAASRGSPSPDIRTSLPLQQPLLDAICMIEIMQGKMAKHDEDRISVVFRMRG